MVMIMIIICVFIFTKSNNPVLALCLRYQNVKMVNFVCLLWGKKYCCVPFCPSFSSKAPTTYCFDFSGIWCPKQSARTALLDLVEIVNKSFK